jgi:hypothetical protein
MCVDEQGAGQGVDGRGTDASSGRVLRGRRSSGGQGNGRGRRWTARYKLRRGTAAYDEAENDDKASSCGLLGADIEEGGAPMSDSNGMVCSSRTTRERRASSRGDQRAGFIGEDGGDLEPI